MSLTHTVTISEEARQALLLCMALVNRERPGWDYFFNEIAASFGGNSGQLYEHFKGIHPRAPEDDAHAAAGHAWAPPEVMKHMRAVVDWMNAQNIGNATQMFYVHGSEVLPDGYAFYAIGAEGMSLAVDVAQAVQRRDAIRGAR